VRAATHSTMAIAIPMMFQTDRALRGGLVG
jgi:hypothetical protein